jgi:hypothetical protein
MTAGRTWRNVTVLIDDTQPQFLDDKNSVTADPVRPGTAYQVWDRLEFTADLTGFVNGPTYLSVTRDFGRTWSTPRVIVQMAPFQQTIGNVIVADPRSGALYNFYTSIQYTDVTATAVEFVRFEVVRVHGRRRDLEHADGGGAGHQRLRREPQHRPAAAHRVGLPFPAIDPRTGDLYMAYEGSDFTGGRYKPDPVGTQHRPRTQLGSTGARQRRPVRSGVHPVDRGDRGRRRRRDLLRPAQAASGQHHNAADEHLADRLPARRPALRHRTADRAGVRPQHRTRRGGLFLGDYQGLATFGDRFRALFVTTNNNTTNNRTDVHYGTVPLDRGRPAGRCRHHGGAGRRRSEGARGCRSEPAAPPLIEHHRGTLAEPYPPPSTQAC